MTSLQQHMPWRPHAKQPPPEIEIEFAQQLRNPQMAYRKLSASPVRSSSETLHRSTVTPKSPSSPTSFMGGFGKGCKNQLHQPFNISGVSAKRQQDCKGSTRVVVTNLAAPKNIAPQSHKTTDATNSKPGSNKN